MKIAAVGELVLPVTSWNPAKTAAGQIISYIDLSAVDNDRKEIRSYQSIIGSDAPSRARQLVRSGDILLSTVRPNLNGVARVPGHLDGATASTGFCVLRPDSRKIVPEYLFHWLRTPEFIADMTKRATGASYPAVTDRTVHVSYIPLPSLSEQRRIAAILDQADSLRRKRQQSLKLLSALKTAAFETMFGDSVRNPMRWPIKTLRDVGGVTQYGTPGRAGAEGGYPVLRMSNITYGGELDVASLKFIDLRMAEVERFTVRDGDILFNRTNSPELVGKTAVFRGSRSFAFAGYLIRLRLGREAAPEYVSAYLNSRAGKSVLRGMCKTIIGMANINAKQLLSITVPIPPARQQQQFGAFMRSASELANVYSRDVAQLNGLFSSLQQRVFGEGATGSAPEVCAAAE